MATSKQKALSKEQRASKLSSKSTSEPTSMEELLAQTGYTPHGLKKGQQVSGVVVAISPKEILLDIGAKTEALVIEKDKKLHKELLSRLSLGDKVNAMVITPESENGHPILSLRKEMLDKNWELLSEKKDKGEEVDVLGVELTRGGLLVESIGVRGFIPLSHLDPSEKPESLIGTNFKAKVLDLDRGERRFVLSQKSARLDSKKLKSLLDKLEIGKTYEGTVSGITNFGIFVKISVVANSPDGEVEGLVHISEISWEKVEDLGTIFTIGQKLHVVLIGIDKNNLKLNLSLKQLTVDPWAEIAKQFAKDQSVRGKVSRVSPFGIFVTLSAGIEGLIHKSKVPPGTVFETGDRIECVVESVDSQKRRIALVPLLKAKPVGYR